MNHVLLCTGYELRLPGIVRAQNCTLVDAAGHTYLDLESGIWCTSVGHSHPRVSQVIGQYSAHCMHAGYAYAHPVLERTSAQLLQITGLPEGKCLFLCSGSEAVEIGVNMLSAISDKPYLLTLNDRYLSAFGSAHEQRPERWLHYDWRDPAALETLPFENIAGFVFEPGSALGRVHFPPEAIIQTLVAKIREHGGWVMPNEVTTGMGRTGKWFGYQHYDFVPDVIALGKGLGNGYPVSAVAMTRQVADRLAEEHFHHAQSHQNDPLGAAVAGEVIQIIHDEALLERCTKLGKEMRDRLRALQTRYGIIQEVRGRGLMLAIELVKKEAGSYADELWAELFSARILVIKRPGHDVLRIDPALTLERHDLEYFLTHLEAGLAKLSGAFRKTAGFPEAGGLG